MKKIQDMTVRERSRLVCSIGAAWVLGMFIFALAVQDWILILLAAIAAVSLGVLFFTNECNTRDDPPHADY
ncbi:hypothetical protein [Citricoccus sp.]|uniref:hypothetical protein n=1 Tax=Citricoccus sp. TaxID=1978372 RepID=UPI0028BDAD3A|nr:hypothetical protein [Citricoccus sp.]